MAGLRVLATTLTGLGLQLLTYALSWFSNGTGTVPEPAISIGPTWTSAIIDLIARVSPTIASLSWMPTLVNLLVGWAIIGLALLGLLSILGKVAVIVLVLVVIGLLLVITFGLKLPVIGTPSNSTTIIRALFEAS